MPVNWTQLLRQETTLPLFQVNAILDEIINEQNASDAGANASELLVNQCVGAIDAYIKVLKIVGGEPDTIYAAIKARRLERNA